MTNAQHAAKIAKMSPHELLVEILSFPEGLTDGYYSYFRTAVYARAKELGFA